MLEFKLFIAIQEDGGGAAGGLGGGDPTTTTAGIGSIVDRSGKVQSPPMFRKKKRFKVGMTGSSKTDLASKVKAPRSTGNLMNRRGIKFMNRRGNQYV